MPKAESHSITTQLANASAAHITPEMIAAYSGFLSAVGRFFNEPGDRITFLEDELEVVQDYLGFVVDPPELKIVAVNDKPRRSRKKSKLRLVEAGEGA